MKTLLSLIVWGLFLQLEASRLIYDPTELELEKDNNRYLIVVLAALGLANR